MSTPLNVKVLPITSGVQADEALEPLARTRYQYWVLGARPVLLRVLTFAPTVATNTYAPPAVRRSMRKPVSLFELSVHRRLICVAETAVAVSPVGAATSLSAMLTVAAAFAGSTS